jgi:hypothetical protein
MIEINQSGFYQDGLGQPILITQGLSGYTLVDKKKILFRLFLYPPFLNRVRTVIARIKYTGQNIPDSTISIPFNDLLIESSIPNGPSVGFIFQGSVFPDSLIHYSIQFTILGEGGIPLGIFVITDLKFQQSGTIRLLEKKIITISRTTPWGNNIEPNWLWLAEIFDAMTRLAAMLPVSDGVYFGSNPGPNQGLAFLSGENIDGWPAVCPNGEAPSIPDDDYPDFLVCSDEIMWESMLEEERQLRAMGVRIDGTVAWRPRDYAKFPPPGGEDSGGTTPFIVTGGRLTITCGGHRDGLELTASIIAQEVGHTFSLVPKISPHYDGGGHSKDPMLIDPYAFDFVKLRPYYPPIQGGATYLGDVMSYAWDKGKDSTLFSAFDWEYLRPQLVRLSEMDSENQNETKRKKGIEEKIQEPFAKIQKIYTEDLESTLPSKEGVHWYWTDFGFQRFPKEKLGKTNSGTIVSAEIFISCLRDLGIKELYVPVDGQPLGIVTSRNRINSIKCGFSETYPKSNSERCTT